MADLSKFTLPDGTQVDLKDAWARTEIAKLSQYTKYLGVTTTPLHDGSTDNPIIINGESVIAESGNITLYGNGEFIFDGTTWNMFGDLEALGDLAFKDSATGSYTPQGHVAAPVITVDSAGTTTTIKNPASENVLKELLAVAPGGAAPSNPLTYYSYDSSTETLSLYQLGATKGASISTADVSVKTGDASYIASAPAFTGTEATIEVS